MLATHSHKSIKHHSQRRTYNIFLPRIPRSIPSSLGIVVIIAHLPANSHAQSHLMRCIAIWSGLERNQCLNHLVIVMQSVRFGSTSWDNQLFVKPLLKRLLYQYNSFTQLNWPNCWSWLIEYHSIQSWNTYWPLPPPSTASPKLVSLHSMLQIIITTGMDSYCMPLILIWKQFLTKMEGFARQTHRRSSPPT